MVKKFIIKYSGYLYYKMSMKKQLLDPIGTMCKLVSLIFCDTHTKISIQDHVLTLQTPSGYQFIIRMYNGDGRENVSELYYVIIRLIKWYIIPNYNNNNINKEDIKADIKADIDIDISAIEISKSVEFIKMIHCMCDAFSKLQETYEFGNVVLTLQFYINLLNDALEGRYSDDKLPKYILEKDKEYENLIDYDKLKNLWDVKKISRIGQLYDHCMDLNSDTKLNEKTRDSLIKGNLRSIYSILDDGDVEFQKLIQNSNRG
jgi:hypothetical protein